MLKKLQIFCNCDYLSKKSRILVVRAQISFDKKLQVFVIKLHFLWIERCHLFHIKMLLFERTETSCALCLSFLGFVF